jgi:glycine cleavage system H protein
MEFPNDLKYTAEHEWVRVEGKVATVGITDYAQDQLGDIVFVELPEEGEQVVAGDTFGVVESTKSVSDLYAPVSGRVVESNDPLLEGPEMLNEDPYGEAWMIKIEITDSKELSKLLSAEAYQNLLKEQE